MTCTEIRELLGAYLDGELAPKQSAAVAEHLASCAACSRDYEAMLATTRTIREGLVRHRAPDLLRARVRAALREEQQPSAVAGLRRTAPRTPWRTVAAALVIAALSSGATLVAVRGASPRSQVADEVLASHIRSLMPDHLTDVRSSDQHNVKPWFNGRLDFSPTVPRFDDAGFPLVGGRLDYVGGRPVAVVIYGRRQHLINSFSWPAATGGDVGRSAETRNGYNLLHWRRRGVEHWVASDLNAGELAQFATLLADADAASVPASPTRQ